LDEHISHLQELVRQPSISQTGEDVKECAELLKRYFADLGCEDVRVVDDG